MALILASGSAIRAAMLSQAGVGHEIRRPDFDEDAAKRAHRGTQEQLVAELAEGKARSVAVVADDWVIGSDSSVKVDGEYFSKPATRAEAAAHLAAFSGRTLELASAAALIRAGQCDWCHAETAALTVRQMSPEFIGSYLDAEWPAVGACVGAFRMEGRGVTLFDRVEGSHFTILGMPLVPLLGALRARRVVPS